MHIRNDFNNYCREASLLAAEFAAFNMSVSIDVLCEKVYDEVKRKLYLNIVKAALENKHSDYLKSGVNSDVERFITACYESAEKGHDSLISSLFATNYTLVGIGAPIRVFLDDVAKMLGTHAVIPENFEVANALGAVMGSVSASFTVEVSPIYTEIGIIGYSVYGSNEKKDFKHLQDAVDFAKAEAKEGAKAEAVKRGANGKLTIELAVNNNEAKAKDSLIYLGTAVTAKAVGSIGF
jgi:hypothetical protein